MNKLVEGTAAVTGAGQGIGLAVATELARRGFDVLGLVLEDAHQDVLMSTAGAVGKVSAEVLDVTNPREFAFPEDLSVLVNNAGVRGDYLPIEETPLEEWRRLFEVNVFGAVEMTRRAIPVLRRSGRGVICNVTSASILRPIPFLAPYRAAKNALAALDDDLRVELEPFGIRVVEVLPGPTVSGIHADSMVGRMADAAKFPAYAPMAHTQFELNSRLPAATTAEAAAQEIVDAILDEDGPMRYGTSQGSRESLARWRKSSDEEIAALSLAAYRANTD